jgi:hypothetical protein
MVSILKLSNISSEIHNIATFVTVDLQTIFHAQFAGILMISRHTSFQVLSSNGSLVIAIKLNAKENVRTAAMLFYFLQTLP